MSLPNATGSFSTTGCLNDILKHLPLASAASNNSSAPLITTRHQYDIINELLNSSNVDNAALVDQVSQALLQVNTSKLHLKSDSNAKSNSENHPPPVPLLQKAYERHPTLIQHLFSTTTSPNKIPPQAEYVIIPTQQNTTSEPTENPRITLKISTKKPQSTESPPLKPDPEPVAAAPQGTEIKPKKFYSTAAPSKPTTTTTSSSSSPKPTTPKKSASSTKQKVEKIKNSLSTWSEHSKSTGNTSSSAPSELPSDFTPELIAQLASEGYDVMGSRKSRQPNNTKRALASTGFDSSSDTEADSNADYSELKIQRRTPKKQLKRDENSSNGDLQSIYRRGLSLPANYDSLEPTENSSFKRFNQLADELFDSIDDELLKKIDKDYSENMSNSNNNELAISRHTCGEMANEAFKLNSYGIMHHVRVEALHKLLVLLYFNIGDGTRHQLDNDANESEAESKLLREIIYEKLLRAADASIISLLVMSAPQIAKELVIEDCIEAIAQFTRTHLMNTIYPHYDPVYKLGDSHSNKVGKAKSVASGAGASASGGGRHARTIQLLYNRLRDVLSLFSELVRRVDMTDTIVITLSSLSITCFFVDNVAEMQLEAMRVLTNIFTRYERHRQLIFDDILSSIAKLHSSKRNLRAFKCIGGESIQMVSALALQLIQCEVVIDANNSMTITSSSDNNDANKVDGENGTDEAAKKNFDELETFFINSYENSSHTAHKFLSVFFMKCKAKQADCDFRATFENFIQDLLITVNKPEWPASEIMLNMLGVLLVRQINNETNDVATRVSSLEYLGQIVSQLRKDSLESHKQPVKLKSVLEKIKSSLIEDETAIEEKWRQLLSDEALCESDESLSKSADCVFLLQKALVAFLDSIQANDSSIEFAKRFLIAQWLKELSVAGQNAPDSTSDERIEKYANLERLRRHLYALIETKTLVPKACLLEYGEAFVVCKYLSSLKKSLDRNFDFYLVNILSLLGGASDASVPTQVRSKALKSLSAIIEADPQVLLKQKVFACVKANFLHQTISVREAAVDLIGRFITLRPELTDHYYALLSDRILDVGVSVRKRVIKIFRDLCLASCGGEVWPRLAETCVKMLKRINDEDGIKKLVIDTFYQLWFAPLPISAGDEVLLQRVLNIVDVISEFSATTPIASSGEFFEQLFGFLVAHSNSGGSGAGAGEIKIEGGGVSSAVSGSGAGDGVEIQGQNAQHVLKSKEVLRSCKQIVDCLIEHVLNTEANTSSPNAYKRLVASFSTLYLLSKIKPENFINHAETLLPYLNIKSTNQNDNQIINSAAKILECVTPLLHCPSDSFLVTLEESLCKLIFQGGMMVVSSCINCLGAVVNKLTKNYKLAADCLAKFYKNAVIIKTNLAANNKKLEPNSKAYIFRMLFTLGLLAKQFDLEDSDLSQYDVCKKEELFQLFLFFVKQQDADVKHKALIGLGSFLTRYNSYMMTDEIKKLYLSYLNDANAPILHKSQIFTNLTDYLNDEDKRNLVESEKLSKNHLKDDIKEMLDVQSGMASTIIQSYLKPILDSYLTQDAGLRTSVINCLHQILTQGLVYPIDCVPCLIAMTTDSDKKIQARALTHLTTLHKSYPGFIQSKSIAGLNLSYRLQKVIQIADKANSGSAIDDIVVRGCTDSAQQSDTLAFNHHLYTLIRGARSFRRAFMQQLLKLFSDTSNYHLPLAQLLFICDNLAYFPYKIMDEPLYIIHQIDIIISVTGINVLQTFKENLLNGNALNESLNTKSPFKKKVVSENIDDLEMSCICPPEEAADRDLSMANESVISDEKSMLSEENNVSTSVPSERKKSASKYEDDDEETFESVMENLPQNLKPLFDCMNTAQGCCLLSILKQFLKDIYSINDARIQNYCPTESAKLNDKPIGSRKANIKFNPSQVIDYLKSINKYKDNMNDDDDDKDKEKRRQLVQNYLDFKQLVLAIDQRMD